MFTSKMIQGKVTDGQRRPTRSPDGQPNVWAGLLVGSLVLLLLALSYTECASLGPTSDPELVAASHNQQQRLRAKPNIMRFRRQAAPGLGSYSSANKLQQLELDEQTMKRQLPELIAQAHQDKSMERALLRMLINASLRSNSLESAEQGQRSGWSAAGDSIASLMETAESPLMGRRAEFVAGETGSPPLSEADLGSLMATIDQLNAGQLQPIDQSLMAPQQSYPMMDKREYIKPCSFNAISCVRTPFRKL